MPYKEELYYNNFSEIMYLINKIYLFKSPSFCRKVPFVEELLLGDSLCGAQTL